MAQNIYDDPEFFEGYSRLGRSVHGLEGAPEWPALQAMLPDVRGIDVVDLGCGFGWFCRWARTQGAATVLGLDASARMLARAESLTRDVGIRYQRVDLEALDLRGRRFGLAYSSLVLHYLPVLPRLLGAVHDALRPGGRFVFSMEHPIFTAPRAPRWIVDAQGRRTWPLDGYAEEGERTTDWIVRDVVKYHRTIGTLLNGLIDAGFAIDRVEEFSPTAAQISEHPELEEERDRPMFLLVAALRS